MIHIKTHMSLTFSPLDTPKMLAVEHHTNEWPGCRARRRMRRVVAGTLAHTTTNSQQTNAQAREEAAASEAACDSSTKFT